MDLFHVLNMWLSLMKQVILLIFEYTVDEIKNHLIVCPKLYIMLKIIKVFVQFYNYNLSF